jgi:hypothetical protein
MTISIILFLLSLAGIAGLFLLKYLETNQGRVFFGSLRQRADVRSLHLKELLDAARVDLSRLPPEVVRLSRIGIHRIALGFAAFARFAESHAHRLADFVSYKHRFEKRDTRSEFLKKVAEHKSGGLDTTDDNGHNS